MSARGKTSERSPLERSHAPACLGGAIELTDQSPQLSGRREGHNLIIFLAQPVAYSREMIPRTIDDLRAVFDVRYVSKPEITHQG